MRDGEANAARGTEEHSAVPTLCKVMIAGPHEVVTQVHGHAASGTRRWLWLTMAVPEPPTNGQFLYSKGLIAAATAAGLSLDIVAVNRPAAISEHEIASAPRQRWWIARDGERSHWASLVSSLPHLANRTNTPEMCQFLHARLQSADAPAWEAIVFDSLAAGWAFKRVRYHMGSHRSHRPLLIYLAHNHETSLAWRLAAIHPHPLKRQINRLDALKVERLERSLSREADFITANAPEDCDQFRREYPGKRIEWLPPVFLDAPVAARWIGPHVPRRAVILGSFDWLPKRLNLVEFVRAADPLFTAAGVELQVVGAGKQSFLDGLRGIVRGTTFTGPVDDPRPHLAEARIGIAAERIGGGFKLKALDYVFNRVPMAALEGTIPGVPVTDGDSAIVAPDASTLARRIIDAIDDLPLLNRLQCRAYRACRDAFDLTSVGRVLASADHRLAEISDREEGLASAVIR